MDYLSTLPLSYMEKDFILSYRNHLHGNLGDTLFGPPIPDVQIDAQNKQRFATVVSRAKSLLQVEVTVSDNGTGKYTVDGHHIDVFESLMARFVIFSLYLFNLPLF